MAGLLSSLAQGVDGVVTLVTELPGQSIRVFRALPPDDRARLVAMFRARLPLEGDVTVQPYYYDNRQLYKMPPRFRYTGPPVPAMGDYVSTRAALLGVAVAALAYIFWPRGAR